MPLPKFQKGSFHATDRRKHIYKLHGQGAQGQDRSYEGKGIGFGGLFRDRPGAAAACPTPHNVGSAGGTTGWGPHTVTSFCFAQGKGRSFSSGASTTDLLKEKPPGANGAAPLGRGPGASLVAPRRGLGIAAHRFAIYSLHFSSLWYRRVGGHDGEKTKG